MKKVNVAAWVRSFLLLCILVLMGGCGLNGTPEETTDEVASRHKHILWNDMKQVQSDIDAIFMLDKPTKLNERIIR
ncbi:MAG: hypothetical protein JW828_06970 [Sedimentisphaerales bacterium]|nr:hypothetical protein [Sedimentisphaerales bacterium]